MPKVRDGSKIRGFVEENRWSVKVGVLVPEGLKDLVRLNYTLENLLRPFDLQLLRRYESVNDSKIKLFWPDRHNLGVVEIELDQLRAAFERISGGCELGIPRDRLGRVKETELGLDYSRPVLSEWAWEIVEALAKLNPDWQPRRPNLTVHLSHDVDRVNPFDPMGLLRRLIVPTRGVASALFARLADLMQWIRNASRFSETYENVMRMEYEIGAICTYFFMSGPYSFRVTGSRTGSCANNKRLAKLVNMADRYGQRVGLHSCAYSVQSRDYARQREALAMATGHNILWHRSHYLVWDHKESPGALKEAGFKVDSTLGFNTFQGFRTGLAWPYELWDLQSDAPAGIIEIPLIFMDSAGLITQNGSTWDDLYMQLKRSAAVGGQVAVNFHLDFFVGHPLVKKGYRRLLEWLTQSGANVAGNVELAG